MTTRNWRIKSNRAGCNILHFKCPDNYVPSILTLSTFTDIGSFTWVAPNYVTSIEYLIVGGGGCGGGAYDTGSAGGGGGGLVLTGSYSVSPGTSYTINVGDGGTGGFKTVYGTDGFSSSFDTIIADGGGGGRQSRDATGGAGIGGQSSTLLNAPTGGSGAGNRVGGDDGGGGGGNTTAGGSSSTTPGISKEGGIGLTSNITGFDITYGAGGNGGIVDRSYNGSSGTTNTGNGGEGATSVSNDDKTGGKGGSGIIILKYLL